MRTLREQVVGHPGGDLRVRLVERGPWDASSYAVLTETPGAVVATPQPAHYEFRDALRTYITVIEFLLREGERARAEEGG